MLLYVVISKSQSTWAEKDKIHRNRNGEKKRRYLPWKTKTKNEPLMNSSNYTGIKYNAPLSTVSLIPKRNYFHRNQSDDEKRKKEKCGVHSFWKNGTLHKGSVKNEIKRSFFTGHLLSRSINIKHRLDGANNSKRTLVIRARICVGDQSTDFQFIVDLGCKRFFLCIFPNVLLNAKWFA